MTFAGLGSTSAPPPARRHGQRMDVNQGAPSSSHRYDVAFELCGVDGQEGLSGEVAFDEVSSFGRTDHSVVPDWSPWRDGVRTARREDGRWRGLKLVERAHGMLVDDRPSGCQLAHDGFMVWRSTPVLAISGAPLCADQPPASTGVSSTKMKSSSSRWSRPSSISGVPSVVVPKRVMNPFLVVPVGVYTLTRM